MGLKTDLLIKEIQEDLLCIICRDVATNPRQCNNCDTLFCQECLESMPLKMCPNKCLAEDIVFKIRQPRIIKNLI